MLARPRIATWKVPRRQLWLSAVLPHLLNELLQILQFPYQGDAFGTITTPQSNEMTETALYACDQCYRCKTRCEKGLPRCQRCQKQNTVCTYSVTSSEVLNVAMDETWGDKGTENSASNQNGPRLAHDTRPAMHKRAMTWAFDSARSRNTSDQHTSWQDLMDWQEPPAELLLKDVWSPPKLQPFANDAKQSSSLPPQLATTISYQVSIDCHCISQTLSSTRDIYLGSIQWNDHRDMAALAMGIGSCEPCPNCWTMPREKAVICSLLFLRRASMCMRQPAFGEAAQAGVDLAMRCIRMVRRIESLVSATADGFQNHEPLATLCATLQDEFGAVVSTMHQSRGTLPDHA